MICGPVSGGYDVRQVFAMMSAMFSWFACPLFMTLRMLMRCLLLRDADSLDSACQVDSTREVLTELTDKVDSSSTSTPVFCSCLVASANSCFGVS